MNAPVDIISYEPSLAPHFRELNLAWLRKYFYVEPIDEEMLGDPGRYIIGKGGSIYFAKAAGAIAGTFALMQYEEGSLELAKMAVDESFQGRGIGNALLRFSLQEAKALGASRLVLFSNTKLHPALHLYRKFGFREVPLGNSEYKRSDIKMETAL